MRKLRLCEASGSNLRAMASWTGTRWGWKQAGANSAPPPRSGIKSLLAFPKRFTDHESGYGKLREMRCGHVLVSYPATENAIEIARVLHAWMASGNAFE